MAETTKRRPETDQDEKQKREMPGDKKKDRMKGEKSGKSKQGQQGQQGQQGKKSREGRDDEQWEK